MKRILYYTDNKIHVFHLQGKQCHESHSFNTDHAGLGSFKDYLNSAPATPFRLVLDKADESILIKTIPHLKPADRQSYIQHYTRQHYPDSNGYIYFKVLARTTDDNKNDLVQISIITAPGKLKPLLDLVQQAAMPISGIFSSSLLCQQLTRHMHFQHKQCLLIYPISDRSLRHIYFINNRVYFSRVSTVSAPHAITDEFLQSEIIQSLRFLKNQQILSANDAVEFHFILNQRLKTGLASTHSLHFNSQSYFHDIGTILPNTSLPDNDCSLAGIISYLCSIPKFPTRHYNPHSIYKDFYIHRFLKFSRVSRYGLLSMAIFISLSSLFLTLHLNRQTVLMDKQSDSIHQLYTHHYQLLEHKLGQAEFMRDAVDFSRRIDQLKKASPLYAMIRLSQIFGTPELSQLVIDKFSWQAMHPEPETVSHKTDQPDSSDRYSAQFKYHLRIHGHTSVDTNQSTSRQNAISYLYQLLRLQADIHHISDHQTPVTQLSDTGFHHTLIYQAEYQPASNPASDQFDLEFIMDAR